MTTPNTPTARVPDSVENAIATPEKEQPYGALGLKPEEYEQIKTILGRRPTSGELAMYSVMWSEHCSYKSSKNYLRRFGQKVSDEMRERLMVGMGQNAAMRVRLGAESHDLSAGDTMSLPGREPHTWINDTDGVTEIMWILVPAAWSGAGGTAK